MARNMWDEWLQGGNAPLSQIGQHSTSGYSPLTGEQGPRMPVNYRPDVIQNHGRDDGANGPGIGKIGTSTPGAWYAGIPQTSFSEFISEGGQDRFRREWANAHQMGQRTEEALGRFSPIAQYWLAALGQDKKYALGQPNAPQRQADLMGKFFGRLLGPDAGYIDPKSIMEKVVGSTWNSAKPGRNDYIANLIANPQLDPDAQVSNFWSFVNGTVGRLMPQGTMAAYQNLIQREGDLYKDFVARNPSVSLTFNKWVQQRLGPTGGL